MSGPSAASADPHLLENHGTRLTKTLYAVRAKGSLNGEKPRSEFYVFLKLTTARRVLERVLGRGNPNVTYELLKGEVAWQPYTPKKEDTPE